MVRRPAESCSNRAAHDGLATMRCSDSAECAARSQGSRRSRGGSASASCGPPASGGVGGASSSAALRTALKGVRRDELGLVSRLRSIAWDAAYVSRIHAAFFPELPLCGNLRNGAWYVDRRAHPGAGYAAFRSVDGHAGSVACPARRLNLDVLRLACAAAATPCNCAVLPAGARGGCMLIDATRSGKRWPDSFSRTVPVWCMVLNRIARLEPPCTGPLLPSWLLPCDAQEVQELVPMLADALPEEARRAVRSVLCAPLVPVWVVDALAESESDRHHEVSDDDDYADPANRAPGLELPAGMAGLGDLPSQTGPTPFVPVIMVSASVVERPRHDRQHRSWRYFQGAGDDEEFWAQGMTHQTLWRHIERLLPCADNDELERAWAKVVRDEASLGPGAHQQQPHRQHQRTDALQAYGLSMSELPLPLRPERGRRGHAVIRVVSGDDVAEAEADANAAPSAGPDLAGDPELLLIVPGGKGKDAIRGGWQALLPRAVAFYEAHRCEAELVAVGGAAVPAALALLAALALHRELVEGRTHLRDLDKADVQRGLFLASELSSTPVPRALLKELVIFFYARKRQVGH